MVQQHLTLWNVPKQHVISFALNSCSSPNRISQCAALRLDFNVLQTARGTSTVYSTPLLWVELVEN
jgi:hypothetical protein